MEKKKPWNEKNQQPTEKKRKKKKEIEIEQSLEWKLLEGLGCK